MDAEMIAWFNNLEEHAMAWTEGDKAKGGDSGLLAA